tara:strand:- start:192 stop:647 length:456 start_codon:yes stop_codon:yes gene_type:complete
MAKRPRLNKTQFKEILRRLVDGESLTHICSTTSSLPSYRTVLRFVQDSDDAYYEYRKARALQAELLRDQIVDLVTAPLPPDPKMAQAEVARRRLEADYKDKLVRQLQPLGLRDKREDQHDGGAGEIVIRWGGGNTLPQSVGTMIEADELAE